MKKQDIEESATQDSENATPSTTEMESSAAVKEGPDKTSEASESQMSQTDTQSQSNETVTEGKYHHCYRPMLRGLCVINT